MEFGGVIYTEAAENAALFIFWTAADRVPLIFPARRERLHGSAKTRSGTESSAPAPKMVNAVASFCPCRNHVLRRQFGAGHDASVRKAYDPRFIFAWPTARYSVMSAMRRGTLLRNQAETTRAEGKKVDDKPNKCTSQCALRTSTRPIRATAAARLWVYAIIDPTHTARGADQPSKPPR